jgi:energy-converting hydrogenase Eha subunit F
MAVCWGPHLSACSITNSCPNFEVRLGTNRSYLGLALHKISTSFGHVFIFRLGDILVVCWGPHLSACNITNSSPNFEVRLGTNRSYLELALHKISTSFGHVFIFRLGDFLVVCWGPHLSACNITNSYPNFEVRLGSNRSYLELALHKISTSLGYVFMFCWGDV